MAFQSRGGGAVINEETAANTVTIELRSSNAMTDQMILSLLTQASIANNEGDEEGVGEGDITCPLGDKLLNDKGWPN